MKIVAHEYAPRGGCLEVFNAREAEVLVAGPAGTGKSRACLEKLYAICMLTPNVRALILRKTLRSLGSSALATWRNYVIKEALETGQVVYYGGSAEEPPQYRFKNGSKVIIGGLDNAMRVMSTEYDIVYIQEATEVTVDDLELVKTRLRNWRISFQQLLMDCNPDSDHHWLLLRCNDGKTRMVVSRHEDNPMLFDEIKNPDGTLSYEVTEQGAAYIAILDNLTGVRYKRLRLGLWVSAEGVIYEEFDRASHILPWDYDADGNRLPLPDEWPRYWVIDFGYVHPFVCQFYAHDPDENVLYLYREIYHTGRTVAEHAQQIMGLVTENRAVTWYDHLNRTNRTRIDTVWTEPPPVAVICDHDIEDRKTFERETGLGTRKAFKAVHAGIDLHKKRLKGDDDGPRFFIMEDTLVEKDKSLVQKLYPTCTVDEYAGYAWKVDKDGRTLDEPVKRFDDGLDCVRYMTAHLDYHGRSRVTLID